jgi:hypothetical protein
MLDVTHFARLWRLAWWTQHIAFPLALFMVGVFLFACAWQALGQLDGWERFVNERIPQMQLPEAQRTFLRELAAALFRLARDGVGPALPWSAAMAIALLLELIAYLLGCGRLRLRLLSMTLLVLIATVALATVGMNYALKSAPGEIGEMLDVKRANSQMLYYSAIFFLGFIVLVPSLLLLTVRGIAVWRLWRHRLLPDLPRTHRMTTLGINLAIPRFTWPHPSAAGIAVHACILLVFGTLSYVFRTWIVNALIFGSLDLFLFVFNTPIMLLNNLLKFILGKPLSLAEDWTQFRDSIDGLPKLILLAAAVVLARAIWRVGRRLNLQRQNEIVFRGRPPMLLLRSFADDVDGIPPNMLIPRLFRRRKRIEEVIGKELTRSGPFVAIGKPGERLPQLGASRLYIADSEWQKVVQSFIAKSDLVIVIAGKTHWVQWELANVIGQGRITKLIIVFPRITEAERGERWQNLKPAFEGSSWSTALERVDIAGALVVFVGPDGNLAAVKSRKSHESDYEIALRVAAYLMHRSAIPVQH